MKLFKKKELETHSPIVYKLYDYLKENAVGYENRVKSKEIMKAVGIKRDDMLRQYILEIRQSSVLQKIICSEAGQNGGYFVATNQEEIDTTMEQLYKRAMEMLKTYSSIKEKSRLDKQMRLKLRKWEKDIWESTL